MRSVGAVFVALSVVTANPASAQTPPSFDYARTRQTLAPQPASKATALVEGVVQYPLEIALPAGSSMRSVVVRPQPGKSPAKRAAVLWVHWLGDDATSNHTEFLEDARTLARRGAVSLLVDMPWSDPKWFTDVRMPGTDYRDIVAQVVSLRQALDILTSSPEIDLARIGYVGHDFGAMDGALLLAVDDRPKYAVLMTPTLSYWEWNLLGKQPDDRAAYVTQMSVFDLPGWLARGRQNATLLQFGKRDEYVAQATGIAIRSAVPNRDRTFKSYDAGHDLKIDAARDDRRAWLIAHLGL